MNAFTAFLNDWDRKLEDFRAVAARLPRKETIHLRAPVDEEPGVEGTSESCDEL